MYSIESDYWDILLDLFWSVESRLVCRRIEKEHHDDSNKERITMVWNGNKPPPYDWESHPWDWLWWLWCKVHRGRNELVSNELPKLLQFLRMHDISVEEFPQ